MIGSTRRELPWSLLCIALLAGLAGTFVFWLEPAPRVGDGSEYFVMTMAWAEQGQPFADPTTDRIYDQYRASRDGSFLSSAELQVYSANLSNGTERDFPHFWFYSLSAAPFYLFLQAIGGDVGLSFTLLHLCLFGGLLVIASREYGGQGIVVVSLICLASPTLWFIDKAHTEFMTITLALSGVIFFLKNKHAYSCLSFSFAACQNPPFALIALLVVGIGSWKQKLPIRSSWLPTCCVLALSLLVICLHPIYYLIRFGSPTPQWITGAASASSKGSVN